MTAPAVTDPAAPPAGTPPDPNAPPPAGGAPASDPPAWTPPATKEDFDKAIGEAVTAEASKYKAPDKYDLKLPDKITVIDPTVVERTAAIARELGLSQDNASKMLGLVASEAARETAAALFAYSPPTAELPEGGSKWKEQNDAWKTASLADKELGDGKPEQLKASADLAKKVLAKFGDPESIDFVDSVLGSNPAALRILVRIGKAMGESALVKGTGDPPPAPKKASEVMYPHGPNLVEGDPRLTQPAAAT